MPENLAPLVALVGFKRRKMAPVGGSRVLVVRGGTVRILGKGGRVDLEAGVGELTARLTRTRTVELRAGETSMVVYGTSDVTRVRGELERVAIDESSEDAELIGPAPAGASGVYSVKGLKGQAEASRAIADALHARGVAAG